MGIICTDEKVSMNHMDEGNENQWSIDNHFLVKILSKPLTKINPSQSIRKEVFLPKEQLVEIQSNERELTSNFHRVDHR